MYNGFVHHDRTHPDQHIIMQGTSMNNCMVSNRHIITNCCAASLKSAMDTSAVLDIHLISHPDKIHIPTKDCIEPNAAIVTHDNVADDGSIGSNERIISKLRIFIFYGKYYRH